MSGKWKCLSRLLKDSSEESVQNSSGLKVRFWRMMLRLKDEKRGVIEEQENEYLKL